jgi:hypothetical protein
MSDTFDPSALSVLLTVGTTVAFVSLTALCACMKAKAPLAPPPDPSHSNSLPLSTVRTEQPPATEPSTTAPADPPLKSVSGRPSETAIDEAVLAQKAADAGLTSKTDTGGSHRSRYLPDEADAPRASYEPVYERQNKPTGGVPMYEQLAPVKQATIKYFPVEFLDGRNSSSPHASLVTHATGTAVSDVDLRSTGPKDQGMLFRFATEDIIENDEGSGGIALRDASAPTNDDMLGAPSVYGNADAIVESLLVNPNELAFGDVIGTGAFGDVVMATWTQKDGTTATVAVKRVRLSADDAVRDDFTAEMSTVAQLAHENIVKVLGLCANPPLIITEYIKGGSVFEWLKVADRAPPIPTMLLMSQQVATGLQYLAEHNVIHRDVAARNVLIRFQTSSKFVCKLTDFGLSRVFDKQSAKSKLTSPIPVRWTPPEVCQPMLCRLIFILHV